MKKLLRLIKKPFVWFKRTSRKKKIITIIVLLIVFFTVMQSVQNATKPPGYTVVKAEVTNVSEIVTESGNITTGSNTTIFSPSNGVIEEVYVVNGDTVSEGDVLFVVNSSASVQEQQAAYANYLAAQTALNSAKSTADSYRAMMYEEWKAFTDLSTTSTFETDDGKAKEEERKAANFQIAQDEWKAAEAKFKDQQTAIAQGQAQVNTTALLYQATQNATVKAPLGGTISNLSISQGGTVKAVTPTSQSSPVLSITSSATTETAISLSELDATKVQAGQPVTIDVTAVDSQTYKGTVSRVDDIGTNTLGVISYNAYIEISNPNQKLKSGMSADVEITTKDLKNVLAVPNAAVKPYQGGRAVRVVDPQTKKVIYKPVVIGIKGDKKTQIIKGIEEGEEVITALSNDQIKRPGLF